MQVFSVKNKNENVEKIEQKKKSIILKVKINNFGPSLAPTLKKVLCHTSSWLGDEQIPHITVYTFPMGISPKGNVIVWLEFELAYYDVAWSVFFIDCWLFGFYGISTFVYHLMPNPFLYK